MTAVLTTTATPAVSGASTARPARDRYLDTLRAVAIIRVIFFHMFGFAWLSYLFPAMGVMFALAGSLMANSMRRSAARAVRSRIRRLLPALWAMGLILVPAMLWHGWSSDDPTPFNPIELVLWVIPVAQPPGNAWAEAGTEVLWYISTYLWLVLLSPLAWRAYRRMPLAVVVLPLLVIVAIEFAPVGLDGRAGDTLTNVATFGACWVVGFAHRAGQLQRMSGVLVGFLAVACCTIGAAWAFTHPAEGGDLNLNEIPLAQAVYSLGFVLVALRVSPSMNWLRRVPPADVTVTALNSRAVTVYLWHNLAIALCFPVGDLLQVWQLGDRFCNIGYFGVALVLLAMIVLALGWVEDVAAKRPPRLLPATRLPDRRANSTSPGRPGEVGSMTRR